MKIAIASSGLGHITRGIESWAQETFSALCKAGLDVELFGGPEWRGSGCSLPAFNRNKVMARVLKRITPRFMWRWGLKSTYGWEQFSFWLGLWQNLLVRRFDILHVQDPMLAFWCRFFRRCNWVSTTEILAHGTEESAKFLSQFQFVQHLAPWHLEHALKNMDKERENNRVWRVIPNLVDTDVFKPCNRDEKMVARLRLGLPLNSFIIGTVSAVKKTHKRIDYAVSEFRKFVLLEDKTADMHFVIAGASDDETKTVMKLVEGVPNITVLLDISRNDMSALYRAMDVFVLCSLFEMQPMAILEAMATGIPVILNNHPVLEWMAGIGKSCDKAAGISINMELDGELAKQLLAFYRHTDKLKEYGIVARQRAESVFAKHVVTKQIIQMYDEVIKQTQGT